MIAKCIARDGYSALFRVEGAGKDPVYFDVHMCLYAKGVFVTPANADWQTLGHCALYKTSSHKAAVLGHCADVREVVFIV